MGKRVILAVAGAGKTYRICENIDLNGSNLIIAYTHENVKNIINGIKDFYGNTPNNVSVMTFDAFVYRCMINPYLPSICSFFNEKSFVSGGITIQAPPPQTIKKNGVVIHNRSYIKKEFFNHYHDKSNRLYNEYLSDLLLSVRKRSVNLIKDICKNLNSFYDHVLVDEFQDFREDRYKLIVEMSKHLNDILLVGDYYQHSVSGTNNTGVPFKKGGSVVDYDDFIVELKSIGFEVDNTTLSKSRRCSKDVSNFIERKFRINFSSHDDHTGFVKVLSDNEEILSVLNDDKIIKLLYENSSKYSFKAMNWSYSKGDTFDDVCVILSKPVDEVVEDNFAGVFDSIVTKNKLYVAFTRPRRNLYIINSDKFKDVEMLYQK